MVVPLLQPVAETEVVAVPRPTVAIDHIQGHRQIHAVAVAIAEADVMEAANVIKASSALFRLLVPL